MMLMLLQPFVSAPTGSGGRPCCHEITANARVEGPAVFFFPSMSECKMRFECHGLGGEGFLG